MKVKALRGVCVGVERHLQPGDTDDLDPGTASYLVNIGAVERIADDPPPPAAELFPAEKQPSEEQQTDDTQSTDAPKKGRK